MKALNETAVRVLVCLAIAITFSAHADPLPPVSEIEVLITEIHAELSGDREGSLPEYIPALTQVDPGLFAIAVVTMDGRTVSVGDSDHAFVIMSAAKPFTAALVMKKRGREIIREKIGVEPTGEAFNSIEVIESHPERSINPMVNAGAMAAVSLVEGDSPEAQWSNLLSWFNTLANADLRLDSVVYASVRDTGTRNRAIAELLSSYDRLYGDPESVRDIYNRQSSVLVTAGQLALMGATLANGGIHPVTRERLLEPDLVSGVLALMTMAGMYDDAGEWAWRVGLPAKSGVGGGVVAVAPGKLAIAAFSPLLDEKGNSVRAQLAIRRFSERLNLGLFGPVTGN
jgi:glutaminase